MNNNNYYNNYNNYNNYNSANTNDFNTNDFNTNDFNNSNNTGKTINDINNTNNINNNLHPTSNAGNGRNYIDDTRRMMSDAHLSPHNYSSPPEQVMRQPVTPITNSYHQQGTSLPPLHIQSFQELEWNQSNEQDKNPRQQINSMLEQRESFNMQLNQNNYSTRTDFNIESTSARHHKTNNQIFDRNFELNNIQQRNVFPDSRILPEMDRGQNNQINEQMSRRVMIPNVVNPAKANHSRFDAPIPGNKIQNHPK